MNVSAYCFRASMPRTRGASSCDPYALLFLKRVMMTFGFTRRITPHTRRRISVIARVLYIQEIFPMTTGLRAPVAAGRLFGTPAIVQSASRANATASFASLLPPACSCVCTSTP